MSRRGVARKLRVGLAGAVVVAVSVGAFAGAAAVGGDEPAAAPTGRAGLDSPTDNLYVPITPCRIVNTQNPAGRFAVGETRSYRMASGTQAQGGAAGCGIPSHATALEVSITAVGAEGNGYLRVHPAGEPVPTATFMNFTRSFNASNAGTVRVRPGDAPNLSITVFQRPTHVVVDVLGYHQTDLFAVVDRDGTLVRGNGVVGVTRDVLGIYTVRFDRNVRGCAYTADLSNTGSSGAVLPGFAVPLASSSGAGAVAVHTYTAGGTRADRAFHLTVAC